MVTWIRSTCVIPDFAYYHITMRIYEDIFRRVEDTGYFKKVLSVAQNMEILEKFNCSYLIDSCQHKHQ